MSSSSFDSYFFFRLSTIPLVAITILCSFYPVYCAPGGVVDSQQSLINNGIEEKLMARLEDRLEVLFNQQLNHYNLVMKDVAHEKEIADLKAKNAEHEARIQQILEEQAQKEIDEEITIKNGRQKRAIVSNPPTSCASLAQLGNRITGFYLIKNSPSGNRIQTVYCDFDLATSDPNYQTIIGFNEVTSAASVHFYVQRTTAYNSVSTAIPYQVERLNIGNAMNLGSGVFTAPTNGRYFFSFVARSNVAVTYIQLRLNGDKFAESYTPLTNYNLPISATLNLKTGDRVDAYLFAGSIIDDGDHFTHFTGFLLEEDLTF